MAARKAKARVQRAAARSAERALKEEREAIAAIVKVFMQECPQPERALARIEAMARAAERNGKTPVQTRRMLLDGAKFIRTAIQREQGKPQELFDPHIGHVKPQKVDALVALADDGQLGLALNGDGEWSLADADAQHAERMRTIAAVQEAIVSVLRDGGAATDDELYTRYTQLEGVPPHSRQALGERRRELARAGRIYTSERRNDAPLWDLIERGGTV